MFHAEKQKDKHATNRRFSQFCERPTKTFIPQTRHLKCFHAFVINVLATCNTNHQEKTQCKFLHSHILFV